MTKRDITNRTTNILLIISILVTIAFPAYNLVFLYPSFDELLIKNTEDEAVRTARFLSSSVFLNNEKINKNDISQEFIKNLENMQSDFEIIELKIYAPDGEVLYCSDTEDIGEVNQHTYFHQIVAKGHKYTKLVPKMSKSSENKTLNSDVVETYIPIMRDGKFAGAFEIYYDVTLKKELLTDLVSRSSIMVIILSIIFMAMSLFIYLRNRKEYSISNTLDNYLEQHKYMSIYLFVITMATVFISEFFIMVMLDRIKKNLSISSELLLNFMDSLILVFVLYPIMYFFVFKPLLIQITERKQMAEFLRVAEKEWDTIFNSISDMISVHGVDFSIKRVNNAFLNFYGVTHKDVIGKKCYEIVHDSTHPFNDCPHLRCIQSKIPEVQEILDENISVPVLESVSPVFDEQGNLTSSVHIAKDITHIKKVEMELKEKAIQLQHLNENLQVLVSEEIEKHRQKEQMLVQQSKMASMGEMISLIAHQWKQPLSAVTLNVQDFRDAYKHGELDDKYIDDVVGSTIKQIEFMAKTIDDFRNFFIPSKKKIRFNVKAAIEELLSMFIHIYNRHSVDISLKSEQNVLLFTEGYPNEFKQVVLNIMNNAKDAIVTKKNIDTELKGSILINIYNTEDKSKIILSLKNNGGEIPDDVIGKIFEPYFTTKEKEGTGIGLYMSKTIIETNMGGTVTVHNVDGGAEFKISLKSIGVRDGSTG